MSNLITVKEKVVLFFSHYLFLKFFLVLAGPIIYSEFPDSSNEITLFATKGGGFENVLTSLYFWVVCDVFWFLPMTIMNLLVFYGLLQSLK